MVNKASYNMILQHHKVVQYPIENDCFNVSIYGHSKTKVFPYPHGLRVQPDILVPIHGLDPGSSPQFQNPESILDA